MNPKQVTTDELQSTCDRLVRQFHDPLLQLRRDVVGMVRETAQTLSPRWPDPADIHGQLFCTLVRGLLIHELMGRQDPDSAPPAGVLRTKCGQGMSVVMEDMTGNSWRVRKVPSEFVLDHDRLVVYPSKAQTKGPKATGVQAVQPSLDPEFDTLPRTVAEYDWFVLWVLSEDGVQVPSVFLAAVHDIDNSSKVLVLAQTPLPIAVASSKADFEEFGGDGAESTGPTHA